MCGRFLLTTPASALAELLGLDALPELAPRYNIAPTQTIGIVRARSLAQDREWAHARWSLVPRWSREPASRAPLFNARAETLSEKPAFRDAFKHRRCLIPASGFYEWKPQEGGKQPFLIRRKDEAPFAFAGLWERWQPEGAAALDSCAIITTTPSELLAPIHDRMPVILRPEDFALWLDPALPNIGPVQELLRPYPLDDLAAFPVSTLVNNSSVDNPDCARPV